MVLRAVGLPNVGEFGEPMVLVDLAVQAEEAGWDGVYVWDHLLYREASWQVASPVVAVAAMAAATSRVRRSGPDLVDRGDGLVARRGTRRPGPDSVRTVMLAVGRVHGGANLALRVGLTH